MTKPVSEYGEFATAIESAQRVKSAFDLYGNNDPNTISKAYQVANRYNTSVDVVLARKDDFFNQFDFETDVLPTITQKALKQPVLDLIGDPNALPVVKNNIQDLSNLTDSLDPLIKDQVILNSVEKVFSNQLLNQQQDDFSFSKMELNKETIMNMPVNYSIVTGDKTIDKAIAQKQLGITKTEASASSVLQGIQATLKKSLQTPSIAFQDLFTSRGVTLTPEQEQAFNQQWAENVALQANPLFAQPPSIPSVNLPVSVLSNEQKKQIKMVEAQAYLAQPQFEGDLNLFGLKIPKQDIWDYGVTNLVQSSPALLAGVLSRSANVAVSIGSLQSGLDQYLTTRQRDATKSDALTAGILNAGIEFATETAPMGALFDLFSGTFGKELGKKEFAKFLGKYVFKDLAGEQIASFAQDAVDTAIANPNKTWGQYFGESGDRAYQTAVGSLFSSAVFGGTALGVRAGMEAKDLVSRAYDRAQYLRSTENQVSAKFAQSEIDKTEALQSANGLYQTLNQAEIVKQTNPIILNKLVDNITQESGVTDIYLDAQSLRQDISKGKISLDEIAQASPFLNASIQESFVSGTDITIPLVDFIQSFSGTPLAQNIVKYTKFNPDASSLSEVENFNEDDLRKDIEKIITGATVEREFNDSTKRVQKTIQTQIENTNRVPKTISSDASKLFATTFESIAMDEGITPEQAFERYGFDIVDSVIDNGKIVKSKTVEGNIISGEYIPSTARPQIALYSSPNMTTILHEFGHAYLDILFKRAGSQNANEKVLDDTKTVLDFFGIENLQAWNALSFEEQSPYHEQFAETYESYLIEGKAVKPKLEKIFLKFSAWLQNFYSNFVSPATKYLITPEIRRVFDNMVLSQIEVKQASETLNLTPIPLEDFTKAGLSEQDYESYLSEYQASDIEAVNDLQKKQLRVFELFSKKKDAIVKGLKNRFEGQRRILKTFVIADMIKNDKDYRLFSFLKTKKINSETIDLPNKINETSLKNLLILAFQTNEIPDYLTKYVSDKKKSISVEELSEFFQYKNPEELLNVLISNPNFDAIIDQKVDEAMVQNFGDSFSPENMAQKAIDVLHKDSTQKIIQKELEVIELQAGKNKTNINFMKLIVKDYIQNLKISLFKPNVFLASEQKAARLFSKSKNTEDRISYKRQQLFNFLMYQESIDLKDRYYQASTKIKSIEKAIKDKKIIGENAEAIKLLLEQYDFRKTTKVQFQETIGAYIDKQIEKALLPENFKETISEEILNQTIKKPYKDLTVKEFNDFIQALDQLDFIGRIEKQQFDANKKYNFEQEKEAILNDLKQYNRKSFDENGNPVISDQKGFLSKFASESMSPEESLLALTDNKPLAPWESFFDRLSRATVFYGELKEEFSLKINKAVNLYAGLNVKKSLALRKMKTEKRTVTFNDGSSQSFTKEESILITLFNGTQEGRERLQNLHGLDQSKVARIVDTMLDTQDVKLVQAIWGATKSHFKLLQEVNLKTTGQRIEQSIVSPFETSKFKFEGGYVPLVYERDLANNIEQSGQDNYKPLATNRGSSKARLESVSKDKKLDFSFGGILFKIDQTMRDISYRQSVLSMNRLLKDKDVQSALVASFGENRFRILQDTVREVINPVQLPDTTANNFIKYAEKSATIAFLSGTSTALLNTMNLLPLSKEVGVLNVIKSSSKFLNPTNYYLKDGVLRHALLDQIASESDFIQREFDAMDNRNLSALENLGREANNDPTTILQDFLPDFSRIAFFMMSNVTKLTGIIAYDAGKKSGKTKQEIEVLYRQNIGTSRQIDKPGGQQNLSRSIFRILMSYLSYMQKQFSVLSASFSIARKNKTKEAWLNFVQEYFFRFVLPSVLLTFIQGAGGDDDPDVQDYLASTIAYTVGGGGIYGLWLSGLAYWSLGSGNIFQQQTKFATPIASVLDGFKKTMQQLSKAEDVEDWTWKEYKNLIRSGGVVLKLPVNLMTSAGQFTSRLNNYFDGNINFEELVFGD